MEQEFKWDADASLQKEIRAWTVRKGMPEGCLLQMDARYFDTPEGALSKRKIALRLRMENKTSVCCLKLRGAEATDGFHSHEEFECPANSLEEGLTALPKAGAPAELCGWLQTLALSETCRIAFLRYAVELHQNGASAELALDQGSLSANGRHASLCEIELEYKSGSKEAFQKMGRELAERFQLRPQPLSKLARARAL